MRTYSILRLCPELWRYRRCIKAPTSSLMSTDYQVGVTKLIYIIKSSKQCSMLDCGILKVLQPSRRDKDPQKLEESGRAGGLWDKRKYSGRSDSGARSQPDQTTKAGGRGRTVRMSPQALGELYCMQQQISETMKDLGQTRDLMCVIFNKQFVGWSKTGRWWRWGSWEVRKQGCENQR